MNITGLMEEKMNKLIIFGSGKIGRKTYRYIDKTQNSILCYVDNDPKKQGGGINGRAIISPDEMVHIKYDYILIASVYWREIRYQLLELGVDAKRIICPLAPMKMAKYKKDYARIYNVFGKIKFYYDRWRLKEEFFPDFMGIFVNPYYFSRKMLYENIKKYSHYMNGKCLDFGCGTMPYKRLLPVEQYVGVEIETENKQPGIIYYDGHRIPFKDETFDSIISSEVFEHVPNIEEIVVELYRVLKPEGIILCTIPFAYPKHCEPFDYKRYTFEGVKNLMSNAGFDLVDGGVSSSYWECMAQFKNVYWEEEVRVKTGIGKILKRAILVFNNLTGSMGRAVLPYSEKLYLDNVIVMKKKKSISAEHMDT